jgi:hypothetical protein
MKLPEPLDFRVHSETVAVTGADVAGYLATAKQWGLMNTLKTEHNGDVGSDEWSRLGRRHRYDPRGLGGFFVASSPSWHDTARDAFSPSTGSASSSAGWRGDFE